MFNTEYVFELLEEMGVVLSTSLVSVGLSGSFSFALFILGGIALYTIAKRMNISNPWISFIPFLNAFSMGRIAQRYVKNDGNKSAKFGPILLTFSIIEFIIGVALLVLSIFSIGTVIYNAYNAIETDITMTLDMFYSLIPVIALFFIFFAIALTYKILYYVALWRVYAILSNENATLFILLSIFFSFLAPIFLFIVRNREPKFTFEERMNIPRSDFEINEEI